MLAKPETPTPELRREQLVELYTHALTAALEITEQLQGAIDRLVEIDQLMCAQLSGKDVINHV